MMKKCQKGEDAWQEGRRNIWVFNDGLYSDYALVVSEAVQAYVWAPELWRNIAPFFGHEVGGIVFLLNVHVHP